MTKHSEGPIRTCIGCRARRPQRELVRCALDADGGIRVGRDASGRGAWLCGPECIGPAARGHAFDRAWRTPVSPDAIERLAAELTGSTN